MAYFDSNDPDAVERMRSMFGPLQVDSQIQQAIQMCWMSLPPERRNPDELEKELRRVFERAVTNLRDDWQSFDFGDRPNTGPSAD